MNLSRVLMLGLVLTGCAHNALTGGELDSVRRPAFLARTAKGAGPKAQVFQNDGSYKAKLGTMETKEADRRLEKKLNRGMNRWEVSERLRASTAALLPKESPWSERVDPADVARVLQSYLVIEDPPGPPDYNLLSAVNADTIIEIVIEDYGMRSSGGRGGTFVKGYGRMFKLSGGHEMWHRAFEVDQVDDRAGDLDPFLVAKTPEVFRAQMTSVIDAVAEQFAKDLTPQGRSATPPGSREDLPAPDEGRKPSEGQDEDLPLPD